MKKILAVFLSLMLLISALAGCGNQTDVQKDPATDQTEYTYIFRDLPEAKYITAASDFAGGDGTESNPYQISDAAQLVLLHERMVAESKEIKSDYAKAHYVLTADIVLNDTSAFDEWENNAPEYSWMPIGQGAADFMGVLDGNGHTISGLYINTNCGKEGETAYDHYGLFDTVGGTVKNIQVEQAYIAVSGKSCNVGSIAGRLTNKATVENCSSNAVLNCYDNTCGGIVGKTSGYVDLVIGDKSETGEFFCSAVKNCSFAGTITQVKEGVACDLGGIVGTNDGNVDGCVNSGTIVFGSDIDSAGGIAGRMNNGMLSNCKNTGTLICEKAEKYQLAIAGGIVGKVFVSNIGGQNYMSRGATITKCENSGAVAGQMYAGGIIGQATNDHSDYCITISECVNIGVVTSEGDTGGVIGYLRCLGDPVNGDSLVVENCENKADLNQGVVGGIISTFISEIGNVTIRGCKNSGALSSQGQNCAGIIAYWLMSSKPSDCNVVVENCQNTGSISSEVYAGGIISYMDMPVCLKMGDNVSASVVNCVNSGDIAVARVNGYVGGILGNWGMKNVATTIDRCVNSGTISITAAADNMTAEDAEKMTISRIAGGIIGRVGTGLLLSTDQDKPDEKNIQSAKAVLKITNSQSTGKLEVVNINAEGYKNWFGGIIGNTSGEDGFAFFVENCTYTEFDRGLGNETQIDIGTKVNP